MAISTVKAVINGQTYDLTLNTLTGKYEATITAPNKSSYDQQDHKYNVQLTATDVAGNTTTVDRTDATLGSKLALRVVEKVAPVITPTYPSAGAYLTNATPTFTWTITDNDSGVDPAEISITINGTKITAGITKTATADGYSCSYTPAAALPEGSNTVMFDAKDYDGNAATQKSVTFTVDTVPPTLNITSPIDGLITNVAALAVSGVTNDVTSSSCTVTIKLNGTDQGAVSVDASGNFSHNITLAVGENTIIIRATDTAGKYTEVVRTVTLDQVAPTFVNVTITPNPVDAGATYVISVEVTDA